MFCCKHAGLPNQQNEEDLQHALVNHGGKDTLISDVWSVISIFRLVWAMHPTLNPPQSKLEVWQNAESRKKLKILLFLNQFVITPGRKPRWDMSSNAFKTVKARRLTKNGTAMQDSIRTHTHTYIRDCPFIYIGISGGNGLRNSYIMHVHEVALHLPTFSILKIKGIWHVTLGRQWSKENVKFRGLWTLKNKEK